MLLVQLVDFHFKQHISGVREAQREKWVGERKKGKKCGRQWRKERSKS